jgi:hypothetical protein
MLVQANREPSHASPGSSLPLPQELSTVVFVSVTPAVDSIHDTK